MKNNINEEPEFKPTTREPVSDQSKNFEKNFQSTMKTAAPDVVLNEIDDLLTEKEQSLKKKIFNLAKMETLVFSDPKLSAVYDEMAENGEEKYGYHHNETIQNIIFNEYVLNSPKYLQKYKMAIPKKKKRRDKSGINQLKKSGEETMQKKAENLPKQTDINVDETTSAGASATGSGGVADYTYSSPSAWGPGDLETKGKPKKSKAATQPFMKGATFVAESNYLIDPSGFEKYVNELLNEQTDDDFIRQNSDAYGDIENMNPENKKLIKKDILSGIVDEMEEAEHYELPKNPMDIPQDRNNKIEYLQDYFKKIGKKGAGDMLYKMSNDIINTMYQNALTLQSRELNEEAKSKAQQRFMGMVHALQKGELKSDEVGDKIKKAAKSMKSKDVEDFAATKHKNKKGKELPEKVKENMDNIKETDQSMLDDNPQSMANKPQPTGSIGMGNVETGTQQVGGIHEADLSLLNELNDELESYMIHQTKLKEMTEEKKPSALVLRDRVGSENEKNFKQDLQHSGTKDVIDVEKEMMWKDQQTDVGDDPQKLGQDIEKQAIKTVKDSLKNVGDSTNEKGDEIPKRNMTDNEQHEVDMMRKGQHSLVYDNKPNERFEERMKADMGDEMYKRREDQMEYESEAPLYNKEPQPIENTKVKKDQFNKEKSGWNTDDGLSESFITGRYRDELNKNKLIEFTLNEVQIIKGAERQVNIEENLNLFKLSFDGLGNKYFSKTENYKVSINETVNNALESYKFYTDGKIVFAVQNPVQTLIEGDVKEEKPAIDENVEKMKHLLGYKPESFVSTKNIKKNRGF